MGVTRRSVLAGAALAGVTACGRGAGGGPESQVDLDRDEGEIDSRHRPGTTAWRLVRPSGDPPEGGWPLVLTLHGRGADAATAEDDLHLDAALARVIGEGEPPVSLASVDGGEAYWHRRASGEDPEAVIREELLPELAGREVDVGRIALLGWSMGGFGALHLAPRLPGVRVALAMSPAIWTEAGASAPGAFDDAEDFARCTPFGRQRTLAGVRVGIDCGEADPFYAATREYLAGFTSPPRSHLGPGGHDTAYWRSRGVPNLRRAVRWLAARPGVTGPDPGPAGQPRTRRRVRRARVSRSS